MSKTRKHLRHLGAKASLSYANLFLWPTQFRPWRLRAWNHVRMIAPSGCSPRSSDSIEPLGGSALGTLGAVVAQGTLSLPVPRQAASRLQSAAEVGSCIADQAIYSSTHFAVALKYDEKEMHAPRVVAKGADLMAQRIRELAAEAGVPIVERAPLARAIFRMVDVGQEIPEQFYSAVAEILAYVYELTGKVRRERPVAAPA